MASDPLDNYHFSNGFVFMCSSRTEHECFKRGLFGQTSFKWHLVQNIQPDTALFLLNFSDPRIMHGVFVADSEPEKHIVSSAWNGHYPSQIRFRRIAHISTRSREFTSRIYEDFLTESEVWELIGDMRKVKTKGKPTRINISRKPTKIRLNSSPGVKGWGSPIPSRVQPRSQPQPRLFPNSSAARAQPVQNVNPVSHLIRPSTPPTSPPSSPRTAKVELQKQTLHTQNELSPIAALGIMTFEEFSSCDINVKEGKLQRVLILKHLDKLSQALSSKDSTKLQHEQFKILKGEFWKFQKWLMFSIAKVEHHSNDESGGLIETEI